MIGWLALLIGIVYGYVTPGRQDKMQLFKMAIVYGIVIAVVLALIGYFLNTDALGLGLGATVVGIIVSVIVISIIFVLGAWIGDFLEEKLKKTGSRV
ncbi:MAG: hypothetical protein LC624_06310 [Halobacteriales archaeon]|nr:hypothetical protein [Halobacteriales archaeon]